MGKIPPQGVKGPTGGAVQDKEHWRIFARGVAFRQQQIWRGRIVMALISTP
jgi:hypothetical protein